MDKTELKTENEQKKIKEFVDIDYSDSIFHVEQTGMQCWSRSSQMMLSYILHKLGLSNSEINTVFYSSLFLESLNQISEEVYLNINQRILGRRLRENESVLKTIDELVVKIYSEFGSTSFLAEIFPSFIKQYLQAFTQVTSRFQDTIITFIMDNDNEEEIYEQQHSCTIIYKTFSSVFSNGMKTGLLKGDDKAYWNSLEKSQKIEKLLDLLKISPVLVESPGHAFVLSGYLPSENKFIVNDSLATETRVVNDKNLLKSLSSIVFLVMVEEKKD